jgi:hypothetical protein
MQMTSKIIFCVMNADVSAVMGPARLQEAWQGAAKAAAAFSCSRSAHEFLLGLAV